MSIIEIESLQTRENKMKNLTKEQVQTINCAYVDLIGAYQAMKQQDYSVHDWDAHLLSIKELERAFTFLGNFTFNEEE